MNSILLAQSLFEKYDLIKALTIRERDDKKYLTDSIENKCRFCGKEKAKKEFRNKAHLIPEFLGNKTLFNHFECNSCNSYFGEMETEFANFMLPYNSLVGTKGKRGIPKYKKKLEITTTPDRNVLVKNYPNKLSLSEKQFEIPVSQEYIPDYVYRSLVKVAVSILDEEYMGAIKHIISWLLNKEHSTVFLPMMIFTTYPFEFDQQCIRTSIYKKKNASENIPTFIFTLNYKNFSFQTFLPENESSINLENYFPFPCFIPNELDTYVKDFNDIHRVSIDLNSKERVRIDFNIQVTNLEA